MTLGDKLAKLRKENNYTQEELAELLGVSRQAISKWESDNAYPETEKLVKLGELYHCSMDYLLKEEVESEDGTVKRFSFDLRKFHFERKSNIKVGGLPLWHVNIGIGRTAKGVFAVGLCAKGIVSLGFFSLGILSLGLFSLGLFALGVFVLGGIAAGVLSVGLVAFGAIAVGILAVGAIAVGQFAVGALSIGNYFAIGDHAYAAIAIGKTKAVGTLYGANAVTEGNRAEIIALLDESVPTWLGWLKGLIKLFL